QVAVLRIVAVVDQDEASTGLDQASRQQTALTDLGLPVALADGQRLTAQLERPPHRGRQQHLEGAAILSLQGIGQPRLLGGAQPGIEALAQRAAFGEAGGASVGVLGQRLQVEVLFGGLLDLRSEVLVLRLAAGAERVVLAAEPAAGEEVSRRRTRPRRPRYRDVTRQAGARTEQPGDQCADVRPG